MKCAYCPEDPPDLTAHYASAEDEDHPEFVIWQARADLRATSGGELSFPYPYAAGNNRRNSIDRGEKDPRDRT